MSNAPDIDELLAERAEGIAWDIQEALRKERIEIAEMLEAEASQHETEAEALRTDYDDADDEAFSHDCDARTLRRFADIIRARTPAAPASAEMTDEIAF